VQRVSREARQLLVASTNAGWHVLDVFEAKDQRHRWNAVKSPQESALGHLVPAGSSAAVS
jgi:hypothetical protein